MKSEFCTTILKEKIVKFLRVAMLLFYNIRNVIL